jgi:chloramphenicol-sensitive protein RarD
MSKGVLVSVLASCMFGVLYFLPTLLVPLTGQELFGWRLAIAAPLVTVVLRATGQWPHVPAFLRQVRERPALALTLVLSSAILGVQQWLFTWAPTHGHGLNVALGFFLMPLAMVVVGVAAFGERLSRWRLAAVLCALLGVINEVLRVGTLSWSTLLPALGFPAYFSLRRLARTDHVAGTWVELILMFPPAVWFALTGPNLGLIPSLAGPVLLLGLLGGSALLLYLLASQLLPFNLFGLLSYFEPVLLVLVSLAFLGERIEPREWLTYVPIWLAVGLLIVEGAVLVRRMRGLKLG